MIDLTFKNELIRKYFQGDNSYVPVSELMYLHEHPLIRQSFLAELEVLINRATKVLVDKNMKGKILEDFIQCTKNLGAEISNITRDNAPKILIELRVAYNLCLKLVPL